MDQLETWFFQRLVGFALISIFIIHSISLTSELPRHLRSGLHSIRSIESQLVDTPARTYV